MRASSEDLGVQGRQLFLAAVAGVEPEVLRTLRQRVLPICREALAQDMQNYLEGRQRGALQMWESPLWLEFERALQEWAKQWHLTDHWILEAARGTAHAWDYEEQSGDKPRPGWLYGKYFYARPESNRLVVETPGWEPADEIRRKAEERIRREVERQIREYLDRVEAFARSQGYKPLPPHRSRERGEKKAEIPRHYRWLAEWQVKKMTQEEIAKAYDVTPRSVSSAIAKLARETGITPRSKLRRT